MLDHHPQVEPRNQRLISCSRRIADLRLTPDASRLTLPTMSTEIPADLTALLDSTAVAFVSTIGPNGEPQTTPIWFLWDAGAVRFSLVEGRRSSATCGVTRRASVVIVDPADPTRYLELRGTVELTADPDLLLERTVAVKYRGEHVDIERPGTARHAATLKVQRVTSQSGH